MPLVPEASDNFNRATGLGANWAQLNPGFGDMQIVLDTIVRGGALGGSSNMQAARWVGVGSFTDDQFAEITIHSLGFLTAQYFIGVICRASGDIDAARDYYYAGIYGDAAANFTTELGKFVNGVSTVLHAAAVPWAAGDKLRLECAGTELRVMKNNVALGGSFIQTDSDFTTGLPGIAGSGDADTVAGDDWVAGNITTGPITGTGTPAAQAGQVDGTGEVSNLGSGAAAAQSATIEGAGTTFRDVTVSLTGANQLRDINQNTIPSLAGIRWEWYDDPGSTQGEPVDFGTFATDASGNATIQIAGSVLEDGEFGQLMLYHPTDNLIHGVFRLPVSV